MPNASDRPRPRRPFDVRLGRAIRRVRKERCLTQNDLGARLMVDQSRISQWELGLRPLSAQQLRAVSEALDVPACRLLGQKHSAPS